MPWGAIPPRRRSLTWTAGNNNYTQLMNSHVQWLRGNSGEYENVIRRSYAAALSRQPSAGELAYWKKQGIFSYVVLLGCHEDWKARSGAAAQKISGSTLCSTTCAEIVSVVLSASVAQEASLQLGLLSTNGGNLISNQGSPIIAVSAPHVVGPAAGSLIVGSASITINQGSNITINQGSNLR